MPVKRASQRAPLFTAIQALANEIEPAKAAAKAAAATPGIRKQAGPYPPDPGGYDGPTRHPSAHVDNGAQKAETGEQWAHNSMEVKEDIGPASIDSSSPDGVPDRDVMPNIGLRQSLTGEDPAIEQDYKATKEDPGTSMPARADNSGIKYSSADFNTCHTEFASLATSVLADLANGFGANITPDQIKAAGSTGKLAADVASAAAHAAKNQGNPGTPQSAPDIDLAGYELADAMGVTKRAAYDSVARSLEQTIRDAHTDADLLGGYMIGLVEKQAADEAAESPEPEADPGGASNSDSGGSDGGSLGGLLGPGDAAPPPPDAAGLPPGAPPGAPPDAGGGQPSEEEALQQLVSALLELGISPEHLEAVLSGAGGAPPPDAAGGAPPTPPDAGGAPPMPPGAADGLKLAAMARNYQRSGRFEFKAAATPRERGLRNEIKYHLRELLGL